MKKDESSMFMTQPNELISPNTNFPKPSKTGAMLHRPNKSLNMSNARYNSFAPVHNVDEQLSYEIQKEKNKISRFLLIKENQQKSLVDKEKQIELRLQAAKKRSIDYEARKKGDEKVRRQDIREKEQLAEEKRKRVRDKANKLDHSSFIMYKEAVSRKHKNLAEE